jgi:hypothetical protein
MESLGTSLTLADLKSEMGHLLGCNLITVQEYRDLREYRGPREYRG